MLLYDETKAVIFGGWDAPKCFNDVYLLDLGKIDEDSAFGNSYNRI